MEWKSRRARESLLLQLGNWVISKKIKVIATCAPGWRSPARLKSYLYDAILAPQRTRISNAEMKSKEKLSDVA